MSTKNMQIVIAVIAVVGFSSATALVIHHNDKVSNDHATMMSDTMHKEEVKKAADDAAMKQKETDKMAQDAMMHETTSTTKAP